MVEDTSKTHSKYIFALKNAYDILFVSSLWPQSNGGDCNYGTPGHKYISIFSRKSRSFQISILEFKNSHQILSAQCAHIIEFEMVSFFVYSFRTYRLPKTVNNKHRKSWKSFNNDIEVNSIRSEQNKTNFQSILWCIYIDFIWIYSFHNDLFLCFMQI